MEKERKKQSNLRKKRGTNEETEDENILQEVLKILEQLFEARLIERIARPIDKKVREVHIEQYGLKLESLHQKLKKIKNEIIEITYSDAGNNRNKSVFGQVTSKPSDWRKIIRNIESKYIQVLIDGSYKFFKKICMALGLSYSRNMELINIEQWAGSCLDNRSPEACC